MIKQISEILEMKILNSIFQATIRSVLFNIYHAFRSATAILLTDGEHERCVDVVSGQFLSVDSREMIEENRSLQIQRKYLPQEIHDIDT